MSIAGSSDSNENKLLNKLDMTSGGLTVLSRHVHLPKNIQLLETNREQLWF